MLLHPCVLELSYADGGAQSKYTWRKIMRSIRTVVALMPCHCQLLPIPLAKVMLKPAKEHENASEDSLEDSGDQSSEGETEEQVQGDLPASTCGDIVVKSSKVLC